MATKHYDSFIGEVFINPIRSVLIVDDDFPTFDEVLHLRLGDHQDDTTAPRKDWRRNPARIRSVVERFRKNDPPLLVDIHDGTNIAADAEGTVAAHLHQSDLLVLDYQLDRTRTGDGTRAIQILRHLMANEHFNLVVVYTKQALETVFDSVRWGLIAPSPVTLSEQDVERAKELLEAAEDQSPGALHRILSSVEPAQYFHSRVYASSYIRTMRKGQQPYSAFHQESQVPNWDHDDCALVFRHALAQVEQSNQHLMNPDPPADQLTWSSTSINWIRTESVFICFSDKSTADDLLAELQKALGAWKPNPSTLFLAKLRAAMDEYGAVAQRRALTKDHALAYWYNRLLHADKSERRGLTTESVSRHSDQLMDAILPQVDDFAERLVEVDVADGDFEQKCHEYFHVDLTKDENRTRAAVEHNALVCSKVPSGWHLTTGHIFVVAETHWLCLSPACDMVPTQPSSWRTKLYGGHLPFVAVRLHPVHGFPKDVLSNRYVFLSVDDTVQTYCFNPSGHASAPEWVTMYAERQGAFELSTLRFTVWQTELKNASLNVNPHAATVVGQLRVEYALNLVQKLGVSLTRIGLDFSDQKTVA